MFLLLLVLAASSAVTAQDSLAVAAQVRAAGVPAGDTEPVQVAVRLHIDPSIKSRRIREGLKDEAASLWRPYGIRLEWREASASDAALQGLTLEASLDRDPERGQNQEWRPVLGHVEVRPDMPRRRPIHVSFDAVEAVLALRTNVGAALKGVVLDYELGIALGRVLAHEIGHVLLGAPYHDPAGLMRASIPPNELAVPARTAFRLTCSGVDRLRSRFGPSIAEAPRAGQYVPASVGVRDAASAAGGVRVNEASCITVQPASRRP
jgi:hypothetical protein